MLAGDNGRLQHLKQKLDMLFVLYANNPSYLPQYRGAKRDYDEALRKKKQSYIGDKIKNSKNKSKTIWSIANSLRTKIKPKNGTVPKCSPDDLVNEFNRYLVNLTQNLQLDVEEQGNKKQFLPTRCDKSFYMIEVTDDEIFKIVKQLRNTSSSGYDDIPTNISRNSIHIIIRPLIAIMNRVFEEGVFPDALKLAVVKPIHKKFRKH